jgi:Sec-independent protein translocase protein TatA
MNFMGMGIPELGMILLVSFLVLGPSRAIDMARNVGKVLGDLRRSFGDVTSAMTIESIEQPTPSLNRDPEPSPGVPMRADLPPEEVTDALEPLTEDNSHSEDKG